MAKLKDVLKSAIQAADWQKVCLVYYHLSGGDTIDPPKTTSIINPFDIDIPEDDSPPTVVEKPSNINGSCMASITSKPNTNQQKKQENTIFIHNDPDAITNPEDKKLYHPVENRHKRSALRNTGHQVEVQCCQCGKREHVASILAHGYDKDPEENTYTCNECNVRGK